MLSCGAADAKKMAPPRNEVVDARSTDEDDDDDARLVWIRMLESIDTAPCSSDIAESSSAVGDELERAWIVLAEERICCGRRFRFPRHPIADALLYDNFDGDDDSVTNLSLL